MRIRGHSALPSWALAAAIAFAGGAAPAAQRDAKATATPPLRAHWAFQTLRPVPLPRVKDSARVRTPVDAFVVAKLEANKLAFSPDADPAALLRRVCLDLTGLPPTLAQQAEFLSDSRADAFERLVDRLLASPHCGERWARHWLDAAGYADVHGVDNDFGTVKLAEGRWRYRDYVVDAFNRDLPYDRFLFEQLAGDELVAWRGAGSITAAMQAALVPTGFLRLAMDDTDEEEINTPRDRFDALQRTGELVAANVLGLTLQCAKCHAHKFEPLSQEDYYGFLANLAPVFNPQQWLTPKQRFVADVPDARKAEADKHNAALDAQIEKLKERQKELRHPTEDRLYEKKLAPLPEELRLDLKRAFRTPPAKRSEVQRYLVGKFNEQYRLKPDEVEAALPQADKDAIAAIEKEIAALEKQRIIYGKLHAAFDTGPAPTMHVLKRGDLDTPGDIAPAGFLRVVSSASARATTSPAGVGSLPHGTSGRRLALAEWLTESGTPAASLVARVWANRVWQQLFGRGIVETSDNLGESGTKPTHPELLDWLAGELQRNGWRLKPLLRSLVLSTTYRQSSDSTRMSGAAPRKDPANDLLWRQRLRQLESEMVRDSILVVSGRFDATIGGAPLTTEGRPDGSIALKDRASGRRSLYLLQRRNYHPAMLAAFGQPAVVMQNSRRTPSVLVGQSLLLMHEPCVLEQALELASRVARTAPDSSNGSRIATAFRIVLSREPSPAELAAAEDGLGEELAAAPAEREAAATEVRKLAAKAAEEAAKAKDANEAAKRKPDDTVQKLAERYAALAPEEFALARFCLTLLNASEFLHIP
jgi:hypothetical protein